MQVVSVRILILALVAVSVSLMLSGCIDSGGQGGTNATPTPAPTASPLASPAGPQTAKAGIADALAGVTWLKSDAQLVGVSGDCAADGTADAWEYSLDSASAGKGYAVTVPGGPQTLRETSISLRAPLGDAWIDSAQAVTACGAAAGECSLDMVDGTPTWTVVSNGIQCDVNATSGQKMG